MRYKGENTCMSRKKLATVLRLSLCFLLTASLLLAMLLLSTLIPRDAIAPRMLESAKFLSEGKQFSEAVEGVPSSRIDRYADSILLGIVWQLDSDDAMRSVMVAAYYHHPLRNENINLLDAVEKNLPPNQEYLRYWHGSSGIVRALMLLMTLPQIYLWHGIIMCALFLGLLVRLIVRREWALVVGLLVGFIGCAAWFVPLSLEYTWVFLILLVQLHLMISPTFPQSPGKRYAFFLVSGMITNYLDFLTCESLTLLVPLLVLLWLDWKRDVSNTSWISLVKMGILWLAGYGGMYLLKWLLAALTLGENVLPYVAGHVEERIAGFSGVGFLREWLGAPLQNIGNLFPLDYGVGGLMTGIVLVLGVAYVGYVYHRRGFDKGLIARLTALGIMPYVRYLLLANHSYLHSFFTYRAQLATLLAVVMIVSELTGWGNPPTEATPRRKESTSRHRKVNHGRST